MRALKPLVATIALLCGTGLALADGEVNFILAGRTLENDIWKDSEVDSQGVFGVDAALGSRDWPVLISFGGQLAGSSHEDLGLKLNVGVVEFSFGAKWLPLRKGRIRPFLGAGIAAVFAGAELETPIGDYDASDSSMGVYVDGGVCWRLGPNFNLGLGAKVMRTGEIALKYNDDIVLPATDANYVQLGMVLGFGWPARR